jgi:hypothetical protein
VDWDNFPRVLVVSIYGHSEFFLEVLCNLRRSTLLFLVGGRRSARGSWCYCIGIAQRYAVQSE